MAADTLASDPNGLAFFHSKLHEVTIGGDRWLFGSAGKRHVGLKLRQTIDGLASISLLEQQEIKDDPDDSASAMVCRGDVVYYKAGNMWGKLNRSYHAVGSGRDFALMAMRLGKSAEEATRLTLEFDSWSGGEVEVLKDGA
jgi:hypothetical protein